MKFRRNLRQVEKKILNDSWKTIQILLGETGVIRD